MKRRQKPVIDDKCRNIRVSQITVGFSCILFLDLSQEAHAIRSHAPLPLDENFGDTRQMLARMAILSNEMLISVELHLSRGLMSKRLELKVISKKTVYVLRLFHCFKLL